MVKNARRIIHIQRWQVLKMYDPVLKPLFRSLFWFSAQTTLLVAIPSIGIIIKVDKDSDRKKKGAKWFPKDMLAGMKT